MASPETATAPCKCREDSILGEPLAPKPLPCAISCPGAVTCINQTPLTVQCWYAIAAGLVLFQKYQGSVKHKPRASGPALEVACSIKSCRHRSSDYTSCPEILISLLCGIGWAKTSVVIRIVTRDCVGLPGAGPPDIGYHRPARLKRGPGRGPAGRCNMWLHCQGSPYFWWPWL